MEAVSAHEAAFCRAGAVVSCRLDGRPVSSARAVAVELVFLPSCVGAARALRGGYSDRSSTATDATEATTNSASSCNDAVGGDIAPAGAVPTAGWGATDVLCGVKCEPVLVQSGDSDREGDSEKSQKAAGGIVVSVRFSPICGLRVPRQREADQLASELQQMIDAVSDDAYSALVGGGVHGGTHGSSVRWTLYADCIVLAAGGGALLDTLSVAIFAALRTAQLPQVRINEAGDAFDIIDADEEASSELEDEVENVEERRRNGVDAELDGNAGIVASSLDGQRNGIQASSAVRLPIAVTLASFGGMHFVVDPDATEEACADSLIVVGCVQSGDSEEVGICYTRQWGTCAVQFDALRAMLAAASLVGAQLLSILNKSIQADLARQEQQLSKGVDFIPAFHPV